MDGEAEILIADSADPADAAVKRFGPGSIVYYPAYQHHTIRNVAAAPVTYLMFKWQAAPFEVREPLDTTLSDIGGRFATPRERRERRGSCSRGLRLISASCMLTLPSYSPVLATRPMPTNTT